MKNILKSFNSGIMKLKIKWYNNTKHKWMNQTSQQNTGTVTCTGMVLAVTRLPWNTNLPFPVWDVKPWWLIWSWIHWGRSIVGVHRKAKFSLQPLSMERPSLSNIDGRCLDKRERYQILQLCPSFPSTLVYPPYSCSPWDSLAPPKALLGIKLFTPVFLWGKAPGKSTGHIANVLALLAEFLGHLQISESDRLASGNCVPSYHSDCGDPAQDAGQIVVIQCCRKNSKKVPAHVRIDSFLFLNDFELRIVKSVDLEAGRHRTLTVFFSPL